MARGTFGERLKRERELRDVPLNEIAAATRIAAKFLEALENEQWEKLPGGVFGRGFVRSVARYLGLSEEDLLSEYDLARGETNVLAQAKTEERIPSPPKWIPVVAVLALIGLLAGLVIGGRYAWRAYLAHRAAKKSSAVVGAAPASEQIVPANAMTVLLELNGREVPPLGLPGSSGTISLTAKDLRPTHSAITRP